MCSERARGRVGRAALEAAALLGLACAPACEPPEQFLPFDQFGGPAGVLEGSVTYSGPAPCTRNGRIVGAAIVLAFDTRLLPPPDGLGTTAASLAVVPGEVLFAGAKGRLRFDDGGKLACPDEDDPLITVSASWAIAPLAGGEYQVRGFYDRDGDFDPAFSIANLPTKGDLGGGALENAADVLAGAPPRFRVIALGERREDGSLAIPEEGARVPGIAVTLALPLPVERPVFHVGEVLNADGSAGDPDEVVMPSDFQLETFSAASPAATERSFMRLVLRAGVPKGEVDAAAAAPFGLPVKGEPMFRVTWQDVNRDGQRDLEGDHVPDSTLVPSLLPLSVFARLEGDSLLVDQARPAVVLQGLTIHENLTATALSKPDLDVATGEIVVGLRPSVLCIDPLDPNEPAVLVVSRKTDSKGHALLADEAAVEAALWAQFGREVRVAYGCLPQGRYSMNLVYDTGQAWSSPNEAGVCDPTEPVGKGGAVCGTRPRLASQAAFLTIGPPDDPAYCEKNPTPKACLP